MKQSINYEDLPKEAQESFSSDQVSYIDEFEFWIDPSEDDVFFCRYADEVYVFNSPMAEDEWLFAHRV